MPQLLLPFFPSGVTAISDTVGFQLCGERIIYYQGLGVMGGHPANDLDAFKAQIGQLCGLGVVTQAEVSRAFGVTASSVKRAVKIFQKGGPSAFYAPRKTRGAPVLTAAVIKQVQDLLDARVLLSEIAMRLNLKKNTLAKAVADGRLRVLAALLPENSEPSAKTKSERSVVDSQAAMGMGATNTLGRWEASLGGLDSVPPHFEAAADVSNGGVLLAIPALQAMGLLSAPAFFTLSRGYYGLTNIFLLLAFMALARLQSLERLRYCAPGEWGKLLGLDRAPEVRTVRSKVEYLAELGKTADWAAHLAKTWMDGLPEQATAFYVDGHTRVYHGKAQIPKTYVARQKLCLRAETDYWVNANDGQPFFVVYQDADPGLIQVLENEILPRLERDVPNQPSPKELEKDPLLQRFTLVFDRAGYSPALLRRLQAKRIACLTYRKHSGDSWPKSEFELQQVKLVAGNVTQMQLAERLVKIGTRQDRIQVREIRRLLPSGHQTSIITTDLRSEKGRLASSMFARWCQENYFKYMIENYGLDRLASYSVENIPDPKKVVNPEHRRLDREVRSLSASLHRKVAELGTLTLPTEHQFKKSEEQQAILLECIVDLREQLLALKVQRKATPRHIDAKDLPTSQKLERLCNGTKQLLDTIRMVSYRAETAMVQILKEKMTRCEDARNLLRRIYSDEVDLIPEPNNNVLRVRIHNMANRSADDAVEHLCAELSATETLFPGTDLRLVYELASRPHTCE